MPKHPKLDWICECGDRQAFHSVKRGDGSCFARRAIGRHGSRRCTCTEFRPKRRIRVS